MLDPVEASLHGLSALGGGLGVGWMAKLFLKSWLKKHDKMDKVLSTVVELLTRLDERVKTLQDGQARMVQHDRDIAVLQSEMINAKEDLNGLGHKVRGIQQL